MRTLLALAMLVAVISSLDSVSANMFASDGSCHDVSAQCACKLIDSAEGDFASPPETQDGGIPIAPYKPHHDGWTWLVVCVS